MAFYINDRVRFVHTSSDLDGRSGTIVGETSNPGVHFYIVLLDEPYKMYAYQAEWRAISMIESCLIPDFSYERARLSACRDQKAIEYKCPMTTFTTRFVPLGLTRAREELVDYTGEVSYTVVYQLDARGNVTLV